MGAGIIHKIWKKVTSNKIWRKTYYFLTKFTSNFISDSLYLKIIYFIRTWKILNISNPKTFNEKNQWLKLHYKNDLLTKLADKYLVRKYVKEKIWEDILIPLLWVYENFNQIDLHKLPDKFILKATHWSGWNVICTDKNNSNMKEAKDKFQLWLKTNFYYPGRSWEYKNIKPRIICEEFLSSKGNVWLNDYKIYCFNWKPRYIQYVTGRFSWDTRESFYDVNRNIQEFNLCNRKHDNIQEKPINLKEMLDIAQKLSSDLPYARIDVYNYDGKIYFGEITLHPSGWMDNFKPNKYDKILGDLLDISYLQNKTEKK